MPNTTLTADVIAKEALMILENNLIAANQVFRGYEDEFNKNVNGYCKGDTIAVRRPAQFAIRTGATMATQDVVEGKFFISVDSQAGVDFKFSSTDLTLKIEDLGERVMKPALLQVANKVDQDILALYKYVPSWVGTAGLKIDSFSDFGKGPERLDKMGVPTDERSAILSASDYWGMLGSQTGLFMQNPASDAYRRAKLGMIGNVDTYMAQNVATHTTGSGAGTGTPLVNGAAQVSTYANVKNTNTQSLITDGWGNSKSFKQGDVLTIANVFAVNPVTRAAEDYLQPFVVMADATSDGAGNATFTISPAIIISGAYQTVDSSPADNAAIAMIGATSSSYKQNLVFHRNAFALTVVPMEMPAGAVGGARKSYNGLSVRVIPVYDGVNDASSWRLDVLYGVKAIDPRLATRLSGT